MPPDGRKRPDDKDRQAILAWLDQALVYIDPKKPIDPGRVTTRRLNRTEYNHTIRDLFGVSIPLANDFPADDLAVQRWIRGCIYAAASYETSLPACSAADSTG